ncbi:hypothetical protein [Nonomuraea ferruginea]|uniref:DNA-directed RNA polymerase specialized sigma24 family protein n=2 Tax=Nonomuraea ferruginea TaxID=46174 RepID=A0ABT4SZP7_9ACTN|nr:hypothetical protein [Nonomuraea ferruginea]MDA0642741.1 hypothetical protein [Nonomuraea ferruginea]
MTHPLTDQRSRREQIAELYDGHAAGLFVYCADQLGDLGSAADVLESVLTSAPEDPPRAALYAFARREIHRRDVVYAPPVVDPLTDPVSALVERILRELRPQQREVLVLGHVCGLDLAELAWVLDVAADTAEELALSAAHRFRQILNMALAATGAGGSKPVADVYGALAVAPLRDVFGRLPWPEPPGTLRIHLAGSSTADPAPLFVKPRWPVPPAWPQPLGTADPATTTVLFPRDLLRPPSPSRVPDHDATTTPMPKFRDDVREGPASFDALRANPFDALRSNPASPASFDALRSNPASSAPFDALRSNPGSSAPFERLRGNPASLKPFEARPTPFEAFRPRRPSQPGAAQPGPAQPGPAQPGAAQQGPAQPGAAQPGPGRSGPAQPSGPAQFAPGRPTPRGAKPGMGEPPMAAPTGFLTGGDVLDDPGGTSPAVGGLPDMAAPMTGDFLAQPGPAREAGPLFTPRAQPREPVYRMPAAPSAPEPETPPIQDLRPQPAKPSPADSPTADALKADFLKADSRTSDFLPADSRTDGSRTGESGQLRTAGGGEKADPLATKPRPALRKPQAQKGRKPSPAKNRKKKKRRNRHHDWAWELIGFLICVAIAMIVFFSVPMILKP